MPGLYSAVCSHCSSSLSAITALLMFGWHECLFLLCMSRVTHMGWAGGFQPLPIQRDPDFLLAPKASPYRGTVDVCL